MYYDRSSNTEHCDPFRVSIPESKAALGPETRSTRIVADVASKSVERLRRLVRAENNSVLAVTGERGAGKTTTLERIVADLPHNEVLQLRCQFGHFPELLSQLGEQLRIQGADEQSVRDHLQHAEPMVIVVDDAQRLVRPIIGGLDDIDLLIDFAHRVDGSTSWLVAIGAPAWQYVRRARGERATFDEVLDLEPWTERQIAQLVRLRSESLDIAPSFDSLVVPRQFDDGQLSDTERTERDYYRILWNASEGNPAVSLNLWQKSLFRQAGSSNIVVRLFKPPAATALDDLPATMYFVLRAIVQLELAQELDIVLATGLTPADVTHALRAARTRGIVEPVGNRFRITLEWYRTVTQVLRRQHLLIM